VPIEIYFAMARRTSDLGRGRCRDTTPLVPLGEHVLCRIATPCAVFTLPNA
jgi:hypothetical protein